MSHRRHFSILNTFTLNTFSSLYMHNFTYLTFSMQDLYLQQYLSLGKGCEYFLCWKIFFLP